MARAQDTLRVGNTTAPIVSKGMGKQETLGGSASQEYTVGKYFVGNDGFYYLVSVKINEGDTITVGTNCTKTDLAAELEGKAKTNHASAQTTYGVGDANNYGHVKVDNDFSDSSTNPIQNRKVTEVKQALSNEVGVRSANGAHNIAIGTFGLATLNGATFTPLSDGTIKVYSASAISTSSVYIESTPFTLKAGSYVFGENPETDANMFLMKASDYSIIAISRTQEDIPFTLANETEVVIRIYAYSPHGAYNNVIYKPLIRWANDADTAWASPAMTNRELTQQKFSYKDNGVLGAKNLLPLSVSNIKSINASGTWSGNAYALRGITYTVETNSDGSVADIKVNGTSTATNNDFILYQGDLSAFAGKLLTGRPSGADGTMISAEMIGSPYTNYGEDRGSGVVIGSGIGANCKVFIRVNPSTSVSNQTFYPMVRLASDTDPTYQPYAMTNKELTDVAFNLNPSMKVLQYVKVGTSQQYTDANDLPPFSYAYGYAGTLNAPTSQVATQFHFLTLGAKDGNNFYGCQIAVDNNASSSNAYVRNCFGTNWSNWNQIAYTT